jgi:hypothetical protein
MKAAFGPTGQREDAMNQANEYMQTEQTNMVAHALFDPSK